MNVLAWYFGPEDNILRNGDERCIAVNSSHEIDDQFVLCKNGLHASVNIIDALSYASGSMLYRVQLSGKMDVESDKISAQRRMYLWGLDSTEVLRLFARRHILSTAHLSDAPSIIIEYFKTGDENIRSAALDKVWHLACTGHKSTDSRRITKKFLDLTWALADDLIWASRVKFWAYRDPTRYAMSESLVSLVMEAAHGEVPGVTVGNSNLERYLTYPSH